ncbi:hypothetical protein QJQ45_019787, partial [Haematococcus lacustris]
AQVLRILRSALRLRLRAARKLLFLLMFPADVSAVVAGLVASSVVAMDAASAAAHAAQPSNSTVIIPNMRSVRAHRCAKVKNFQATLQHTKPTKVAICEKPRPAPCDVADTMLCRFAALAQGRRQTRILTRKGLASPGKYMLFGWQGVSVDYQSTLRVVTVEGDRAPRLPPRVTQKPPGYIRNESGGLFTS